MSNELYGFQADAVEALRGGIRDGHLNQILQSSTGSGKTVMATSMIRGAESKGIRSIFLADTIELVEQAVDTFDDWGLEVGVMQGNHYRTDEHCLTQVCTPQTLRGRLKRERDKFERYPVGLIIPDECHVQYSVRDVLRQLYPRAPMIGLTATPFSKGLGDFYTNVVSAIPMQQLFDEGRLCPYTVYGPSKPDMKGVGKAVDGDFKEGEIGERYTPKLVADILQTWLKMGKGKPTLGFAAGVPESRRMAEIFREAGIRSEHIDGYGSSNAEREQRKDVIARYKAGEIEVLWNCAVLTKGFDAPRTECLIIARPTTSLILHFQMLGRLTRVFAGKEMGIVLDHAGNFDRLIFPEQCVDFTLNDSESDPVESRAAPDTPDPCKCGACGYTNKIFFSECPQCGSTKTASKPIKEVLVEEGVLVEKKPKKDKGPTPEQMQEFYSGLLGVAQQKKYADGWAYHQFREKFKQTPDGLQKTAAKPGKDVKGWMTYQAIRRAKGGAKHGTA